MLHTIHHSDQYRVRLGFAEGNDNRRPDAEVNWFRTTLVSCPGKIGIKTLLDHSKYNFASYRILEPLENKGATRLSCSVIGPETVGSVPYFAYGFQGAARLLDLGNRSTVSLVGVSSDGNDEAMSELQVPIGGCAIWGWKPSWRLVRVEYSVPFIIPISADCD